MWRWRRRRSDRFVVRGRRGSSSFLLRSGGRDRFLLRCRSSRFVRRRLCRRGYDLYLAWRRWGGRFVMRGRRGGSRFLLLRRGRRRPDPIAQSGPSAQPVERPERFQPIARLRRGRRGPTRPDVGGRRPSSSLAFAKDPPARLLGRLSSCHSPLAPLLMSLRIRTFTASLRIPQGGHPQAAPSDARTGDMDAPQRWSVAAASRPSA